MWSKVVKNTVIWRFFEYCNIKNLFSSTNCYFGLILPYIIDKENIIWLEIWLLYALRMLARGVAYSIVSVRPPSPSHLCDYHECSSKKESPCSYS